MNGLVFGLGLLRYFTLFYDTYNTGQKCKRFCLGEEICNGWRSGDGEGIRRFVEDRYRGYAI